MEHLKTDIPDLKILEPKVYEDGRGFFFESWTEDILEGIKFVQDNHSQSTKGVLRGLHYQVSHPQGKLVRCVRGEVYDVAVDLRESSETFGQWRGVNLSEENKHMFWIPPGFAHGFLVLSDVADVLYKATNGYDPDGERSILWCDEDLKIQWPIDGVPTLSEKDRHAPFFQDADLFL